jgi:hypothetical protein
MPFCLAHCSLLTSHRGLIFSLVRRPFSFFVARNSKVFDIESWNFTGLLLSMWSCAPGYFCVDLFRICYCLWLSKTSQFSTCVARSSKSIWHKVMKLYRNVAQHVKMGTWGFAYVFFLFCQSYCPWFGKNAI